MKTAIVLGTFDGIHDGHRAVIAAADGYKSVALTFNLPPKTAVGSDAQLLMTPDDRKARLYDLGVNRVVMMNFEDVQNVSAEKFLEYIKNEYDPALISCGFNYRFGTAAQGDVDMLSNFCGENGIRLAVAQPVEYCGVPVSSTALRRLITAGEVFTANKMIYKGFSFTRPVERGDRRGREIGFPTANQRYPEVMVKPKFGVYTSRVIIDGKEYDAVTNIGIRPTFETAYVGCETYIKDFSGDLYGKKMTLNLVSFLREEKQFASLQELKEAISADIAKAFD